MSEEGKNWNFWRKYLPLKIVTLKGKIKQLFLNFGSYAIVLVEKHGDKNFSRVCPPDF